MTKEKKTKICECDNDCDTDIIIEPEAPHAISDDCKEYLSVLCDAVYQHLNLQAWEMNIDFQKESSTCNDNWSASIVTDLTYLRFFINFYPSVQEIFEKADHNELISIVIHEMTHVFIEPLFALIRPYTAPNSQWLVEEKTENAVEGVTRIIQKGFPVDKYAIGLPESEGFEGEIIPFTEDICKKKKKN